MSNGRRYLRYARAEAQGQAVNKPTIYFRYGDNATQPQVAHNTDYDCPYGDMKYHHPSECGDGRIARLALEGENIIYPQPLFSMRKRKKGKK